MHVLASWCILFGSAYGKQEVNPGYSMAEDEKLRFSISLGYNFYLVAVQQATTWYRKLNCVLF